VTVQEASGHIVSFLADDTQQYAYISDARGKDLFHGPVMTEAQRRALPEDYHRMLKDAELAGLFANFTNWAAPREGKPPPPLVKPLRARFVPYVGGVPEASLIMVDPDGRSIRLYTRQGGRRYLLARDADGRILVNGPVETEAQRKAVPEPARRMMEAVEQYDFRMVPRARLATAQGQVEMADGDDSLSIMLTQPIRKCLMATNPKNGESLFVGYIDTEEERKAVPARIREKLEQIEKTLETITRPSAANK
jgi:hypothetical protein